MIYPTSAGTPLESKALQNYLSGLVNKIFKILPIREKEDHTLCVYMRSLQVELLGFRVLIEAIECDHRYTSILSILQYLIDNPCLEVFEYKREVFKAISLCNKLIEIYCEEDDTHGS